MITSTNKKTKVPTIFYSNVFFFLIKTPILTCYLLSAIEFFLFCNFCINNLFFISNCIIVFSVLYSFLHNCILYNLIQIKSNLNQLNVNKTGSYIIRYDFKMYVDKCICKLIKEETLKIVVKNHIIRCIISIKLLNVMNIIEHESSRNQNNFFKL